MSNIFKLPGLGETIETITVVNILVKEGDNVTEGQTLFELEGGKAVLELPSPFSGVVRKVLVKEGEEIEEGQDLLVFATEGVQKSQEVSETIPVSKPEKEDVGKKVETIKDTQASEAPKEDLVKEKVAQTRPSHIKVHAAPSIRKFAREIGINIDEVPGTGPNGRVSIEDVKTLARHLNQSRRPAPVIGPVRLPPLPNFEVWGPIDRQKMDHVRYQTAVHISRCWSQIPMVTQFGKANITKLEGLRKKHAAKAKEAGGNLTMAVMTVKVVASALKIFPNFNASVDLDKKEIIYKKYFNIGIAVSTERGLFVPVLKNVDQKNMIQIAAEVSEIARKTREGKIKPGELEGGSFTITNLGGIAGTHFTPIVNYPEAGILGMGRSYIEAGYINDEWKPQIVLPLSLTYDHRLVDGADGARFLKWVIEAIEDPLVLSLEG